MSSWIQTHTGGRFNFNDLSPASIHLEDIAHALGNLCRFTGHSSQFYSVAEHSCHVSDRLQSPTLERWGLLHDAAEAYIGDMSTPLKIRDGLEAYRQIERKILEVIAYRFALTADMPPLVKDADRQLLVTEATQLLPKQNSWITGDTYAGILPSVVPLPCWSPGIAKQQWLRRAAHLGLI